MSSYLEYSNSIWKFFVFSTSLLYNCWSVAFSQYNIVRWVNIERGLNLMVIIMCLILWFCYLGLLLPPACGLVDQHHLSIIPLDWFKKTCLQPWQVVLFSLEGRFRPGKQTFHFLNEQGLQQFHILVVVSHRILLSLLTDTKGMRDTSTYNNFFPTFHLFSIKIIWEMELRYNRSYKWILVRLTCLCLGVCD